MYNWVKFTMEAFMPNPSEVIQFVKGTNGGIRAYFKCGTATVPAILITRLANDLRNESQKLREREFTTKLNIPRPKKVSYSTFLNALDDADISYIEAFNYMATKLPVKKAKAEKTDKIVPTIAKLLKDKKSKSTAEERFDIFSQLVANKDFREKTITSIKALEANLTATPKIASPDTTQNTQTAKPATKTPKKTKPNAKSA